MGWGGAVGGPPPSVTGAAVCGQQGSPMDSLDTRRAWGLGRRVPLTGPAGCATARSARAPRPSAAPPRSRFVVVLCGAQSFCAAPPRSRLCTVVTNDCSAARAPAPHRHGAIKQSHAVHTAAAVQRCEPAFGWFAQASWVHDQLFSCRHDQSSLARARRTALKGRPPTISTGGHSMTRRCSPERGGQRGSDAKQGRGYATGCGFFVWPGRCGSLIRGA